MTSTQPYMQHLRIASCHHLLSYRIYSFQWWTEHALLHGSGMHADGGLCTARHAALVDGKGAECHGRQHACRQETETDSSLVTRFAEQTGLSKFLCGCSGVHADGSLCTPGHAARAWPAGTTPWRKPKPYCSLVISSAEQTGLSKFLCGCSGVHADGGLCAPGYAALAHDQRAQLHGGQHAAAGSHHGPRAVPQSGGVPA